MTTEATMARRLAPRADGLVVAPTDDVPLTRLRPGRAVDTDSSDRAVRALTARLDLPVTVLGVVFLLVVVGQSIATAPNLRGALNVAAWVLWIVFVAEFALRWWLAPDRIRFIRRYWWQAIFLLLPMMRFVRLIYVLRAVRVGRVLSSAVRSSRSASRVLSSRLGWLAATSVIVALGTSQVLYLAGSFESYGDSLHRSALATFTGEPLGRPDGLAKVLDVVLAVYSVAVFAGVAAAFGTYLVRASNAEQEHPRRQHAHRDVLQQTNGDDQ
ncbi:MAG: hypothetical protein ABI586_04685 [Candidatus Nanopelagicales bacterium]